MKTSWPHTYHLPLYLTHRKLASLPPERSRFRTTRKATVPIPQAQETLSSALLSYHLCPHTHTHTQLEKASPHPHPDHAPVLLLLLLGPACWVRPSVSKNHGDTDRRCPWCWPLPCAVIYSPLQIESDLSRPQYGAPWELLAFSCHF